MQTFIEYQDKKIHYTIVRRKRKTVGIAVSLEKGVEVAAPKWVSLSQIKDIVNNKAPWIVSKLALMDEIRCRTVHREFAEGELLPLLGGSCVLKISRHLGRNATKASFEQGAFAVSISETIPQHEQADTVKNALLTCYKNIASEYINRRVIFYSQKTGLIPSTIRIKEQKTRWGSCSSSNALNFNWKLIMAPEPVIDYVVVHELSHIKVKNHSQDFWRVVESIIPDYKKYRNWLKANGHSLTL
ncbi:MAG: M48 family metallopeptidase [Clostridia bacterium]|nr:M48 family metallopeptidase [Clostridia bacterium]